MEQEFAGVTASETTHPDTEAVRLEVLGVSTVLDDLPLMTKTRTSEAISGPMDQE